MGNDNDISRMVISDEELASFESEEKFVKSDNGEQQESESDLSKNGEQEEESESKEEGANLPEGEISEESEKTGKEELVYKRDGKEYSEEDINEWFDAHNNKDKWQKSNTKKAQGLAKEQETFVDKVKSLKDLVKDEEAMVALDDYYGDKSKNPLRGLDLELSKSDPTDKSGDLSEGEESKSEVEKRLESLETKESERIRVIEEEDTLKRVTELVDRDISELIELDADMKDSKKQKEVIDHAIDWSGKHEDEPPMSLKSAWLDIFGKKKLTANVIKENAIEGNKSVSGGAKGSKTATYKTSPKDYDEAMDRALSQFQELEG